MKAVITIVGRDQVGIVAMVSGILATNGVNVLNINQNILDGFFNMLMISDISKSKVSLKELQEILKEHGQKIGLDIKVQHEDIFNIMHRI
ncbi:ACT domain-containing protein [Pelosinus sp. sgz500959]|uniref:ACT domain-containing protein n=1 Tax=Pelosinus sp. sgz500959 TaxID=3242472 RepID=UPI0036701866